MKSAAKVSEICQRMVDASASRNENHALLNDLYNGAAPWTEAEATQDHQHCNVNWLEGTEKIHEARSQAKNALKGTDNYFTVKLDIGSPHRRRESSLILSNNIKRITKRSRAYSDTIDASVSQMIVQGIGPSTWMDRDEWWPKARSIDDMLIPHNTYTSMENLHHFALRIDFTVADLVKKTNAKHLDKGWNLPLIKQCITQLKAVKPGTQMTGWSDTTTDVLEDYKQNGAYYESDAVPVLRCFDFYLFDPEEERWNRKIIVDTAINQFPEADFNDKFLYDNDDQSYGDDVSQILCAQIADGAVVAPAKWHSVRSLGYMLYPMCQSQNRLRCKFMDAVWESMNWYFRDVAEGDREVLQKIDLRHLGVIPNGLKWVLPSERHTINFELLSGAMSMNRQLMSENSSSFTRDTNDGSQKEMTATETMARLNQANKLQTSIMANIYDQQIPQYREICRRLATTTHPDCVAFRRRCLSEGVDPAVFKDTEAWEVIPERVTGGGDKMLQVAIAKEIMVLAPRMNPRGQAIALHDAVEAISSDAQRANELAPLEMEDPSPSAEKASLAWGTLIDGKPVTIAGEVNRIEFVEELFTLLAIEFKGINESGAPPPLKRIQAIGNVVNTIKGLLQQIAGDESQADWLRDKQAIIGNAENIMKGWVQQLQQAAKAQAGSNGHDPKLEAEIKAKEILANATATVDAHNAEQKRQHKEVAFQQEQARRDQKTAAEISAQGARTQVELAGAQARNRLQEEAIANKPTAE